MRYLHMRGDAYGVGSYGLYDSGLHAGDDRASTLAPGTARLRRQAGGVSSPLASPVQLPSWRCLPACPLAPTRRHGSGAVSYSSGADSGTLPPARGTPITALGVFARRLLSAE